MKFRTEIDILKSENQIDYSNRILALGSCFASSIGEKLLAKKFSVEVNPVGVLYNPLSIASALQRFHDCRRVTEDELQQGREGWYHFDFHSSMSASTSCEAQENMNQAVESGAKALAACDTIIITLGTVWVYRLDSSGEVVANCHKQPSKNFVREAMSVKQVVDALAVLVERYHDKNFIFTLSPIRHMADGLVENSLSKATLRVAVADVVARYDNASYFPSYEILMDDLRDYRFYADDMVHPSPQAVEYIWYKFCESYVAPSAQELICRVEDIVRAAAHRPFNAGSAAHIDFCRKQIEKIKELPEIDLGKENEYFMGQLQNIL